VATKRRRRPSGGRSVSGNGHGTPLLATLSTDEESSYSSVADSRSVQRQHFSSLSLPVLSETAGR